MTASHNHCSVDVAVGALPQRRFEFARDTFAFANELVWSYDLDPATGRMSFARRSPPPTYAHRCFVLTQAARQFHYHAHFSPRLDPSWKSTDFEKAIREVLQRNPRQPCPPGQEIEIPGFPGLREFSRVHESSLKRLGGGAWRSYVLRSHWRMVFPISRRHQAQTAQRLTVELKQGKAPIIHLVDFPRLKINHGMILYDRREKGTVLEFSAYDPNSPEAPCQLQYDPANRTFTLPPNRYWAGGRLNVIEIFRNWWM